MRFPHKIFLLIIFISTLGIRPAFSGDTIHYSINWLSPIPSWFKVDSASGKVLLNFQDAKHNVQGIPVFIQSLPIEENCSEVKLNIISLSFDTIPLSNKISHSNEIPESLSFSAAIIKEQKKKLVQITFVPFIKKNEKLFLVKGFKAELIKNKDYSIKKGIPDRWKSSSVLNTNVWRKIAVSKTGVYKISFSELKDLGIANPAEVRVFGNGGAMLSEKFSEYNTDDLNEIPLYISKGSDNIFNEGDFILFYATGPINWTYDPVNRRFTHSRHNYNDKVYYFITSGGTGKLISDITLPDSPEELVLNSFVDYDVHEENLYNLIRSGRNWYGEQFGTETSRNFNFTFPSPVENNLFSIEGQLLARSEIGTGYTIKYNNQTLVNQTMNRIYTSDETSNYADIKSFVVKTPITSKDVAINISFDKKGDASAEGWIDYLRVNVRRKLIFNADQLMFRDTAAIFQNKTVRYNIDNCTSELMLWDVSTVNSAKKIPYTLSGQQISFKAFTDTLHNYVLFDPSKVFAPDFLKEEGNIVANQNLHATPHVQMVIIAPEKFLTEAEELANIHRNIDNLTVMIVTPEQIYNEFSSGNPDPVAYRNFMKMLYDKATDPEDHPKYLLLFGDGSYKNLSTKTDAANSNLILTYQSDNSLRPVSSYVSDDFFGLLDDEEVITSGALDIGIGRLPVTTVSQAKGIINKIKKYISANSSGSWKNNICFIADDEDGNIHMSQADQLANYLNINFPSYNAIKLYSDAFPQITTSSGPRYPEVNKAIENTLNLGTLIMNYTGHGGEEGLAHEQILRHEEVKSWRNTIYPLFVTATCEFSRFDDYEITTAGEDVLLNENGGGIALFTTTRLVYSGPNFVLNQEFYKNFEAKDESGEFLRLGDLMRRTKNAAGSDVNKLCFTLLGDPALRLAYPHLKVQTTEINGREVGTYLDTLKAYNEVTVKGKITDNTGNTLTGFNGVVYPSLYDKEQAVESLNNDNTTPFNFKQRESILFKGRASVKNGEFEFSFVVPREIAYNFGNGKLSYYASDENTDAAGFFNQLVVGGISSQSNIDNAGPEINLYLNDYNFRNGGVTNQIPLLLADLSDDNGINISGTGIGHNITGILDENTSNSFILNNYFESEIDNFRKGTIRYILPQLKGGKHTLTVKAWDIFNNSTTAEITFEVADSSSLVVKNLYNYPNPFSGSTTFVFDHNQPGKNLEAELQIYNTMGSLIARETFNILTDGFSSGPLFWDGKNIYYKKLERGIYIYRFVFRYNGSEIVSESKKMVVSE
jgi:hypothetical protein